MALMEILQPLYHDNGSNFVKAFKMFSVTDISAQDCPEDCVNEEVIFENVHDTLTLDNMDLTQEEYDLPTHERCTANIMNLVVSTDITKSLSTSSLSKTMYRSSFAKRSALWNKAH